MQTHIYVFNNAPQHNNGKVILWHMLPVLFQGKAAVDAAKAADIEHLVFSSAENVKEAMGKASKCMDGKAVIEEYIKELGKVIREQDKIINEQSKSIMGNVGKDLDLRGTESHQLGHHCNGNIVELSK